MLFEPREPRRVFGVLALSPSDRTPPTPRRFLEGLRSVLSREYVVAACTGARVVGSAESDTGSVEAR